jgi:hypothetical protein
MPVRVVLVWTLVGLGVRAVVFLEAPFLHMDGPAYIGIAETLSAERWRSALTGYFPPLYPAAIRLVHAAGFDWETAGRLVAGVAGVAVIPLGAALGTALLGAPIGHAAAALAAVHPRLVRASADVLPETLGAVLVAAVMLLVLRARPLGCLVAGAVGGVAGQLRPELVLLVPLAALGSLVTARPGRRARCALAACAGAAAVLVPIALAMYAERGAWVVSGKERYFITRKYGTDVQSLVGMLLHDPGAFAATYARFLPRQIEYTLAAMEWLLAVGFLAGIAVAARDASARRAWRLSVLVLGAATLALAINPARRYVVPWLPMFLPWIAYGGRAIAERAAAARGWVAAAAQRTRLATALIFAGLLARSVWPQASPQACYGAMCAWVEARVDGRPTMMADDSRMAYVCGGRFLLRPHRLRGRGDEALALAAERGATILVIPAAESHGGGGPTRPPDAELCQTSTKPLLVYEIELTARSRAARPRTPRSPHP